MRASWVRRSQIPVIKFKHQGDKAKGEANQVVKRQPESSNTDGEARGNDVLTSPPLSPKTTLNNDLMDISVSSVFTSLNLKRKAVDSSDEERCSKLLRLCAPELNPNPRASNTKSTLLKINHKPKRFYTERALKSNHPFDNFGEVVLCDVPIGVGNHDGVNLGDVSIEGVTLISLWIKGHFPNEAPNMELSRNWAYFNNPGFR
ncbi:hypothetical protein RHSIM_Rhsim09G0083200 [Rhododendron simsii]|uniref:Uncharacterized protein n=1 Tax=Rhododendron simsii TaxID=118357 RepID=A0A834LCK4_RHOSS|nr:hypothetical protein RHSIM_Rhsim09G0083200 [Rhododendron simsii]